METHEQLNIYMVLLAGTLGMLVLILGLVLFIFLHRRKVAAQELHLQKTRLQYQQELLEKNMQTQEDERRRIARDLHDEVGSMLSTLRLYLAPAPEGQEPDNRTRKEMIDRIIGRVRHISHELLPPGLELFGLQKTMEDLCLSYKPIAGLSVRFDTCEASIDCAYDKSLALFRILQELLHNTIRHSGANQVEVQLTMEAGRLRFGYRDNGCGFDPALFQAGHGLGLGNIESRARMAGGVLRIDTAPGKGFGLELEMPIDLTVPETTHQTPIHPHANTH